MSIDKDFTDDDSEDDFMDEDFEDDEQSEIDEDGDGFSGCGGPECTCGKAGGCDWEIDECYEEGYDEDALPCSIGGD